MVSFLSRCAFWAALSQNHWVDFTRDYPGHMENAVLTAMFPLQFLIFNVVPYSTLMLLHLRNFKKKPSDERPERGSFSQTKLSDSNRTGGRSPREEIFEYGTQNGGWVDGASYHNLNKPTTSRRSLNSDEADDEGGFGQISNIKTHNENASAKNKYHNRLSAPAKTEHDKS